MAEGNLGLLAAVSRFDATKGYKFITYAVWCIRQAMKEAAAGGRHCARVPMNRIDDMRKMQRHPDRLGQQLGRSPTFDEVITSVDFEEGRALAARRTATADVSFDGPAHDGDDERLADLLPCESSTEEDLDVNDLRDRLLGCLQLLEERERYIICAYYGIEREDPRTLNQIGRELQLTRERVRQFRNRALDKMQLDSAPNLAGWSQN